MLLMNSDPTTPALSVGKTSPECSVIKQTLSVASWLHLLGKPTNWNLQGKNGATLVVCLDPKEQQRGGCLTPNTLEWPNDAAVSSLSQVLERGLIPPKYYLSARACAGILRRAEKRGKKLPLLLEQALRTVAQRTGHSAHPAFQHPSPAPPIQIEAKVARIHSYAPGGGNNTSGPIEVATACNAHGGTGRLDFESETFVTEVTGALQANGKAAGSCTQQDAESGMLVTAFNWNAQPNQMNFSSSSTPALTCSQQAAVCIGLDEEQNATIDYFGTLKARVAGGGFEGTVMLLNRTVRRLMPVECERLQGMPDNHTAIPGAADGPRYKAIGNSKAVPVVWWIGRRLQQELRK